MLVDTGDVTFQYAELTPRIPGQAGIGASTVSSPSSDIIVVTSNPYGMGGQSTGEPVFISWD
jgi:hypothetical protein